LTEENVRELFRYTKGDQIRVYSLRVISGRVELWRATRIVGLPPALIKEADVSTSSEAMELFGDIERSLTAGGWRACSTRDG